MLRPELLILILAVAVILLAVKGGAFSIRKWKRWKRFQERELFEDALKHLLEVEQGGAASTLETLAGSLELRLSAAASAAARMEKQGFIRLTGGKVQLTEEGRKWALHVMRAHRLWERYLRDEAHLRMDRLHAAAHRLEHLTSDEQLNVLDAHLGHPTRDPHGDPIPDADGAVEVSGGTPLSDWPAGEWCEVVHMEDEPPELFRTMLERGISPGSIIQILRTESDNLICDDGSRTFSLPRIAATNVQVKQAPGAETKKQGVIPLAELPNGAQATVDSLDPRCRGFTRRRLLDLGLTPGTLIKAELQNSFGDPRAFRVRGTLVALRKEQAAQIWVRKQDKAQSGERAA